MSAGPRAALLLFFLAVLLGSAGLSLPQQRPSQSLPHWRAEMGVRIGLAPGPGDEFMDPRVAGVDGSGKIYVLDQRLLELSRYDPAGRFLNVVSTKGEGPGDLREGIILRMEADSIWYADRSGRLQWMTTEGDPVRTLSTGVTAAAIGVSGLSILDLLDDSTVLVIAAEREHSVRDGDRPGTTFRYLRVRVRSRLSESLLEFRTSGSSLVLDGGRSFVAFPGPSDDPIVIYRRHRRWFLRIERETPNSAGDAVVKIETFDEDGNAIRSREIILEAVRLPKGMRDSLRARLFESASMGGSRALDPNTRRVLRDAATWPEYLPPVEEATIGVNATLWLKMPASDPMAQGEWLVLDSLLTPVAWAHLPPNVKQLYFVDDAPWVTALGANDVPFVARLRFPELRGQNPAPAGSD
jgi:hypothetical protein